MSEAVEFEWDAAKAERNLAKHGVRFASAISVFMDPDCIELDVTRDADSEVRRKTVGLIEGRLFTVVFTLRDDRVRIISARRSNSKEERVYGSFHA